jgi:phenylalanyl-tRNA synthetase beta chain
LEEGAEPDVYDGTGLLELLTDKLGVDNVSLVQAAIPSFHPGRAAEIRVDDIVIGAVGEIHPAVSEAFGLSGRVVGAELDLLELLVDRGAWQFVPPSVFPPIIFDLAFFVPNDVAVADFLSTLRRAAGPALENASVFDVFEGEGVGEGTKSVAIKFTLRAPDQTLSEDDAAPVRQSIVAAVAGEHSAVLRGTI